MATAETIVKLKTKIQRINNRKKRGGNDESVKNLLSPRKKPIVSSQIDIVIPWVNSNDPKWKEEKNKYSMSKQEGKLTDDREERYRDWDIVRYLLRSIEMYMPWVRYVFFITHGHLPEWMNTECSKLRIINHKEYIPEEYLPTFSSHTIELNLHRIKDLSEQFIYFNDDLLVMKPAKEEDFFCNGLPRDYAILSPITSNRRFSVQDIALTDVEVVNDNFHKNQQIKNNFFKWLAPCYKKELLRTFCLMPWPYFAGFLTRHQGNAFLKSTFEEVWEKEYDILDSTCSHKFRTKRDVNQWVMRYWQLASGKFVPIAPYGEVFDLGNDNAKLLQALNSNKHITICINDNNLEKITDYDTTKKALLDALERRFPVMSSFEMSV